MATRTVFLRFGSNVSTFAGDMQVAADATKKLTAASAEAMAAQNANAQVMAEIASKQVAAQNELLVAEQKRSGAAAAAASLEKAAQEQAAEAAIAQVEYIQAQIAAEEKLAEARAAGMATPGWSGDVVAARQVEAAAKANAEIQAMEAQRVAEAAANAEAMAASAEAGAAEAEAAVAEAETFKRAEYLKTQAAFEAAQAKQAAAAEEAAAAQSRMQANLGRNALIGGLVGAAGLYEIAKQAMAFQTEMTRAAAVSTVTRQNFAQMSQEILDLSTRMPVSAKDFADALVVAEQAGYQGYNAINLLSTAAEGAVVGFTDTKSATEDLARVLNGYGLQAKDAAMVNNLLVAGVKNGIGSYHDFGDALAQMAPLARASHIQLSDMAAALVAMSTKSQDAGASGMALIRTIFQMTKVGTDAEGVLVRIAQAHGHASAATGQQVIDTLGLVGTMKLLGEATGGELEQIERISPSVRSAKGALALLADGGNAVAQAASMMADQQKLAEDEATAWATAQGTAANKMKVAENQIQATAISFGQQLLPVVAEGVTTVGNLASKFNDLTSSFQGPLVAGVAMISLFGIVFGLTTKLAPAFKTMGDSVGYFSAKSALSAAEDRVAAAEIAQAEAEKAEAAASAAATMTGASEAEILAAEEAALAVKAAAAETVAAEKAVTAATEVAEASNPFGWIALGVTAVISVLGFMGSQMDDNSQAVNGWTDALNQSADGATTAVDALILHNEATDKAFESLNNLNIPLSQFNALIADGASAIPQSTTAIQNLAAAIEAQHDTSKSLAEVQDVLNKAIAGNTGPAETLLGTMKLMGDGGTDAAKALQEMLDQINAKTEAEKNSTAQTKALQEATDQSTRNLLLYGDAATDASGNIRKLTDDETELQNAVQKFVSYQSAVTDAEKVTADRTQKMTDSVGVFKDVLKDTQAAIDAQAQAGYDSYQKQQQDTVQAAQDAAREVERLHPKDTKLIQAAQDNARAVERSTQDSKKSLQDFKDALTGSDGVNVSIDQYLAGLQKAADKQQAFDENLQTIARAGGSKELIDSLRKLGTDGAPLVQQFADQAQPFIDDFSAGLATQIPDAIQQANASIATLTPETKASFQDLESTLQDQLSSLENWQSNLMILASKGGTEELVKQFIRMGPGAAGALAQAIDPANAAMLDGAEKTAAQVNAIYKPDGSFAEGFQANLDIIAQSAGLGTAQGTASALSTALAGLHLKPDDAKLFLQNLQADLQANGSELGMSISLAIDQEGNPAAATDAHASGAGGGVGGESNKPPGPGSHTGNTRTNADGNILRFGNGGENHVAQFASGGDWRVWAEPETGGEAYIPLGMAKRQRSMAILGQVADEFGYELAPKGQRPAGTSMVGAGGAGGDPRVVVVTVKQPTSQTTKYEFNGEIHGYKLEDVQRDAERKKKFARLTGRTS